MPVWVKVFGLIALLVVVLLMAMLLIGGEEHGPGQHSAAGDSASTVSLQTLNKVDR